MFKKSNVAIVTPFQNGEIDYKAFKDLVNWQIDSGTNGITVCGATGESATLTDSERENLIKSCIETTAGRVPVMVGVGTSSTGKTIQNAKQAKSLGADAVLVVTPYYNKPTQEGIYQHFKAINDSVDIPIFIYNNPPRVVININDDTVARIAELKNIAGLKDSPLEASRPIKLANLIANNKFLLLSGEDQDIIAHNASGGMGAISITANVVPELCSKTHNLCAEGNFAEALEIQKKLMPLHTVMTCESNPIPVKYALSLLGKISPEMRLPLVQLQPESKAKVEKAMKDLRLI